MEQSESLPLVHHAFSCRPADEGPSVDAVYDGRQPRATSPSCRVTARSRDAARQLGARVLAPAEFPENGERGRGAGFWALVAIVAANLVGGFDLRRAGAGAWRPAAGDR